MMDLSVEFSPKVTIKCASTGGKKDESGSGTICIPCVYKLFPSGYLNFVGDNKKYKLPPNQRPETCHRTNGPYEGFYTVDQKILTVGDGDLSFSTSLSNHFMAIKESASNLTATTHESYASICSVYQGAKENAENLRHSQARVFHEIDATQLDRTSVLSDEKFDIVIWNFPCIRVEKGADGQVSELDLNKRLLRDFFRTVQTVLKKKGEVHIAHKTVEPFSWWGIESLAEEEGLHCFRKIVFDRCLYPGYRNRKVLDKKSFPCNDARVSNF